MHTTRNCWEVLGLPPGSDKGSIKQKYAKLLKTARPEDDPVAFQQLHDAYTQALKIVLEGKGSHAPSHTDIDKPSGGPATVRYKPLSTSTLEFDLPPPFTDKSHHEQAWDLLNGLGESSLEHAWNKATAQQCDAEFERLLFKHCADDPFAHPDWLQWGLEQRQWLTPWQRVSLGEFDQQHLANQLTDALYERLDQYMADLRERRVIETLAGAIQQAWLGDFERRQALHVHMLDLLLNTEGWSPSLFQNVCRLFGWDAENAVVPVSDEHWSMLKQRCAFELWVDELREQAKQPTGPLSNAATLFLMCTRPDEQVLLVKSFVEVDWQACEQLSQRAEQFPNCLQVFPNRDPWFWKGLITLRGSTHGVKRTAFVLALCLGLKALATFELPLLIITFPLLLLLGTLGAFVGKWIFEHWHTLTDYVVDTDLKLSEWCVRHNLIADRGYRVISNGGPLIGLGVVIWSWVGLLALATYLIIGVIGVLQPASATPRDRTYRWRKPLQAIYRIAGFSALQWLAFISLVGLIGYLQLTMPGTFLTRS